MSSEDIRLRLPSDAADGGAPDERYQRLKEAHDHLEHQHAALQDSYYLSGARKKIDIAQIPGFAEIAARARAEGRAGMHLDRLFTLWQAVQRMPAGHPIVEVGAYLGGSARFISEACRLRGLEPRFYVCDTFSGHARTDPTFDLDRHRDKRKFVNTSPELVADYLAPFPNVQLVVGDIMETAPAGPGGRIPLRLRPHRCRRVSAHRLLSALLCAAPGGRCAAGRGRLRLHDLPGRQEGGGRLRGRASRVFDAAPALGAGDRVQGRMTAAVPERWWTRLVRPVREQGPTGRPRAEVRAEREAAREQRKAELVARRVEAAAEKQAAQAERQRQAAGVARQQAEAQAAAARQARAAFEGYVSVRDRLLAQRGADDDLSAAEHQTRVDLDYLWRAQPADIAVLRHCGAALTGVRAATYDEPSPDLGGPIEARLPRCCAGRPVRRCACRSRSCSAVLASAGTAGW